MSGVLHCAYCRRQLIDPKMDRSGRRANLSATRDHITPKCRGGRKTVWACRKCNGLKADLTPERWRLVMEHHPRWWAKFNSGAEVRSIANDIVRRMSRERAERRRVRRFPFHVARPPLCRGLAA